MKKQETQKKSIKIILMVMFLAIFIIFLSDSSKGWNRYQHDSWKSGKQLEFSSRFDLGVETLADSVYGTSLRGGQLLMEIHNEAGVVNSSALFLSPASTNELRAFVYDPTPTPILDNLDTIDIGYLRGDMFGADIDTDDDAWDIFGIFSNETGTNHSYFKWIQWNKTSQYFQEKWSVYIGDQYSTTTDFGTNCGYFDGFYSCFSYTDSIDNTTGGGYGDMFEFRPELETSQHRNLNFSAKSGSINSPLIYDFDRDDHVEVLFYCTGDSSDWVYICSFDTFTFDMDTTFGVDGVSQGIVSSQLFTGGRTSGSPMLIDTGSHCSFDFFDCFTPPEYECWDCDGHQSLKIVGAGVYRVNPPYSVNVAVKVVDDSGTLLESHTHSDGIEEADDVVIGGLAQYDCDNDGIEDILYTKYKTGNTATADGVRLRCIDALNGDVILDSRLDEYFSTGMKGLIQTELDGNPYTKEFVTDRGIYSINQNNQTEYTLYSFGEAYASVIVGEINGDTLMDVIVSKSGETVVFTSNESNNNPYFIGDGAEIDTCTPVCVNETVTFYARQDLDYEDAEDDSAYLGVDCFGEGIGSVVWGSNDVDPQVTCNYDELGEWETTIFITDYANFPSYTQSMSMSIYTSLAGNCYESGQFDIECSPSVLSGVDVDEDDCFNDDGLSVCMFIGTSSELCDTCGCLDIPQSQCYGTNETELDGYESTLYNWDGCSSWRSSLFYGLCPFYQWAINALGKLWTWIFTTFFIVLTLVLIMVIGILIFKKRKG